MLMPCPLHSTVACLSLGKLLRADLLSSRSRQERPIERKFSRNENAESIAEGIRTPHTARGRSIPAISMFNAPALAKVIRNSRQVAGYGENWGQNRPFWGPWRGLLDSLSACLCRAAAGQRKIAQHLNLARLEGWAGRGQFALPGGGLRTPVRDISHAIKPGISPVKRQ